MYKLNILNIHGRIKYKLPSNNCLPLNEVEVVAGLLNNSVDDISSGVDFNVVDLLDELTVG